MHLALLRIVLQMNTVEIITVLANTNHLSKYWNSVIMKLHIEY